MDPPPYRTVHCVPATHPCLPGHFPGTPIVPAVVLLELVLQSAEALLGADMRVSRLEQAKFVMSLLPEEPAHLELQLRGDRLDFRMLRGEELLAHGRFQLTVADPL